MPYRLRLFHGDRLLLTTVHDTPGLAGRRVASFPLDDFMEDNPDGSSGASIRRELVSIDSAGNEQPTTEDEEAAAFDGAARQMRAMSETRVEPCPRCGLRPAQQEQPYPVLITEAGPVCFGCWTDEERTTYLDQG